MVRICKRCRKPAKRYKVKLNPIKGLCRPCYYKVWRSNHLAAERICRRTRYKELRVTVLKAYGNKCSCCRRRGIEFLTIDHVNGGGRKHRKAKGSMAILRAIIKLNFPKKYRILCWDCNGARGVYGYCHKKTNG